MKRRIQQYLWGMIVGLAAARPEFVINALELAMHCRRRAGGTDPPLLDLTDAIRRYYPRACSCGALHLAEIPAAPREGH